MSENKLVEQAMAPVPVTIIGTGTGDGKTQLIRTPEGQPNVLVTFITPLMAIVVRFIIAFLTTLIGLVGAGMISNIIPFHDFMDLLVKCATLSVAGAAFDSLKNLLTLFTRLRDKFPLLEA